MCGIIYSIRFDGHSAIKLVKKQYDRQKGRGKEGFGYVASKDGVMSDYCRATTEHGIMTELDKQKAKQVNEIMFHHRFPTSTPNFHEAAHPIWVSHPSLKYDYFVVHNGVITNDDDIKKDHDKLGFKYQTLLTQQWVGREGVITSDEKWNDSEAFAIELARDIDDRKTGIGKVRGSIAFICMQVEKDTGKNIKLFFGRNASNPLKYKVVQDKYIQIASEAVGFDCAPDHLYELDYATRKISEKYYCIGGYYVQPYSYSYEGHASRDDDPKKATGQMGFLPAPVEDSEEEDISYGGDDDILVEMQNEKEAEEYYQLMAELIDLEDDIKKGNIKDELEKTLTVERIAYLNKEITKHDEEFLRRKLAVTNAKS